MSIAAKILLVLSAFISLYFFIILGIGGSSFVTNPSFITEAVGVFFLALAIYCLTLLAKKPSLKLAVGLLLLVIVSSGVVLASLNCLGVCVSQDHYSQSEMNALKANLAALHDKDGEYPDSLPPQQPPILHQSRYSYTKTDDSYSLCTMIKTRTFYGIPLGAGTQYCIGP